MEMFWIVWLACIAALAFVGWQPILAWRLRNLPGPSRLPFLGNLPGIFAKGSVTLWREDMGRRYGRVYKMWNGSLPLVVVSDIDLSRKLLVGSSQRPNLGRFGILTGENRALAMSGLISMNPATHGAKFRSLRKAFELAVLTPAALAAHAGMLCQNASRLVTYLSRYAASGEPLDMTVPLSDMTMDAIGFAAFGLDLDCLGVANIAPAGPDDSAVTTTGDWTDAPPGSLEFSRGLVDASRTIFRASDITRSSRWRLPTMLLPFLFHVVRHLANWFPDRLMKIELKARGDLIKAVRVLIAQWERQKKAASATNGVAPLMAISDRGFLAKLLESAKAEGMTEIEVVAQAFTMVLAGYETTASTLAASLHLLAQNPQAQTRLQAELDDVLHGKLATTEDLDRLPYLSGVIDEALRVYPPADAVRLLTPEDQDLDVGDGRIIPGGAFVLFDVHAMHHDPAIWPRATEFLPERFIQPGNEALAPSNPNALIPFGLGARMCPGYKFALMEGRITLARLLQAYTFKPAPGCPVAVWKSGIVYSADQVWLTISPRMGSVKA